jgi:hypothetical protein
VAVHLVGGAAYQGRFHFQFQVQNVEDLDRLGDDFGTNAVTGKTAIFIKVLSVGDKLKICQNQLSWGQSTR